MKTNRNIFLSYLLVLLFFAGTTAFAQEYNKNLSDARKKTTVDSVSNKLLKNYVFPNIAKKMAEHSVFPVNWFELNPNQIIGYLEYKEYQEYENKRGKYQIINEWKTVKTFAKAYGIDAKLWGYIPPSPPKPKVKIVPLPNTTYQLIQHKYSKNLYKNALIQYILLHGFTIG